MAKTHRYSAIAIVLHWLIAFSILANLLLGWRMHQVIGLAQFTLFQLHKSIGITVLVFSVLRLGWRLLHPAPPLPATMAPWERRAAHATHGFFYLMMIGMPLTGWAMVSVSPYNIPTLLWHHIPWPHIGFLHTLPMVERAQTERISGAVHYTLAIGGCLLILLHVAAALKHHFINRDGVLAHMLPWLARPSA